MTVNTIKTKIAKLANMSIQQRSMLERSFINYHHDVTEASNTLRINRVYAGQILLELKDGFDHGDWLPYLSKLCERAGVPARTAGRYMADARVADKIPSALLAEAKRQGFNIEARHIRRDLVDWMLNHPDDARPAQHIVKDALGVFTPPAPPAPPLTAEEKAAELEDRKKWREGAKTREAYAAARAAQTVTALADQEKMAHELIEAGYRALAKKYHSDVGGTDEQFRLLKEAKALVESRTFSRRED